ncbi:MmcQ/YjbR family DNA-binding protein [Roseitranquillus sediminis]|uniref:MmcQ/YjbR family DNA-binding protein n=1 Tax=Roseitranquillus sediminis TaxID=2809051 RepID=UPI001D0C8294|nr:MmcQ/YjbR family DNA-binding protein [Roseitranquillus sediminis]MBM9594634.1 MmcQ/YjbR family DNA-binding protein [Roseitranquillus sediminis]
MTPEAFRTMALAQPATTEAAHFDRRAFRVRRIYATLAADGASANLALPPDEQEHYCRLMPHALAPVPNSWGARGWTTVALAAVEPEEIAGPLSSAWLGAGGREG